MFAARELPFWRLRNATVVVMILRIKHDPPGPWQSYCTGKPAWMKPLLAVEWPFAWLAYTLSRWSFLEVLEYLGSFSVLIAVIFYFRESGDRLKQKHYQAWQVINTAQHMGGSGGRIEALSELNADGVPLVGVNLSKAFLQAVVAVSFSCKGFRSRPHVCCAATLAKPMCATVTSAPRISPMHR